ncbi:MAG: phosphatase PAP2 family protein [Deltaproteobacteria bacterium]|nr:phosphatase PAP2 family protein [Deltaproteobacteria bacterium]
MTSNLANAPAVRQARSARARLLRDLAAHDWAVGGFLVGLLAAALVADPHPLKTRAVIRMTALALASLGAILAARGGLVAARPFAPLLYRIGVLGGVLGAYFVLRDLAPVVNPHALDGVLYAADVAIFGGEPAVWIQRFVTPDTTEWFAFFYVSYFWLLALYTLPFALYVDREPLVAEFATGMIVVYGIGQALYLLVPGFGPWAAFPELFDGPLPRGPWHDALLRTVAVGGSQKDIFPSLHTAGPLFLTLFAFRHRGERWLAVAWAPTAFFAANIVAATLLLRWHYAIDVVAGAVLGVVAFVAARRLPAAEAARRRARAAAPLWPRLTEPTHPTSRRGARCDPASRPSFRSPG